MSSESVEVYRIPIFSQRTVPTSSTVPPLQITENSNSIRSVAVQLFHLRLATHGITISAERMLQYTLFLTVGFRRMEWILDFLLLALPLTVGVPWLLVLWVLPPILLVTVPLWSPCVSTQICFGWNGVRHFQTNQLVYDHFDNFFSEKLEQVESIYPLVI